MPAQEFEAAMLGRTQKKATSLAQRQLLTQSKLSVIIKEITSYEHQ